MKLQIKNPKEFISDLKANKEAFQLICTSQTKTIITESNEYYFTDSSGLRKSELNLIKQVKDFAIDNNIKTNCNKMKIQYINKELNNGLYKKDIFEIDLNKAYWNLFYKNEFTSNEIYLKGLDESKIRKSARLVALGNLAKQQIIFNYNGLIYDRPKFINSPTEKLFFKVSQQTDNIMNKLKLIAGKNYLFYWVDAIFFKSEQTKNEIAEYLNDIGMNFKLIPIKKLHSHGNLITVTDELHTFKVRTLKNGIWYNKGELKPRPFIFETFKKDDYSKVLNNDFNIENK